MHYAVQALVFMRAELPHEMSCFVPSISDGCLNPHRIWKVIYLVAVYCIEESFILLYDSFCYLAWNDRRFHPLNRWDSGAD